MHSETDKIASKWLGKRSNGSEEYDSSLLVAVPRQENRSQYNIKNNNLPFIGWDVWHAYEFSAMTKNCIPVTRLLKLKYNCNNDFIVESKSLKLYLNSFNMTKIGNNIEECLAYCKKMIETDLSNKLQTEVTVNFIDNSTDRTEIFSKFENIMRFVDENSVTISTFKESPELIKYKETQEIKEHYLMFDSLRSNCRVTHQPDFGDVFIYYKSSKFIEESSLLQYLVSFRSEYHFHEECCEMIYKRLFDILDESDELFVCALYTRRGGIDICPARWSKNCKIDDVYTLLDLNKYARCGIKQ
ncbi:NADPH-dependent 7-cyano-7-deazaguanine reductase QueF [bacterium]|nr:NADPH-dependent 7-cyano-7-deazaguanine reductase QueF [bacterium]